jgi:hypothetical protein
MAPFPRNTIEAPAGYKPKPFGLLQTIAAESFTSPHSAGGVEYQTPACGHNVGYASDACVGVTATTTDATAPNLPATVTVNSDYPGTYTINWGDATGDATITITEGETTETTPTHMYATAGPKTITVTGPSGFGVHTINVVADTTATYSGTAASKAVLPADVTVFGDPVTVLGRYDCRTVGMPLAEQQARAMEALNVSESWALEKILVQRVLAPATVDVTGGTGTSIERAVALLENYAAVNYAAQPVLHLTQFAGSLAQAKGIIERHGNKLETVVGSLAVVGAGYSAHPVGASTTIYVTGRIVIQQGAAQINQAHRAVSASPTNETVSLAERTSVIAAECIVAKALVTAT